MEPLTSVYMGANGRVSVECSGQCAPWALHCRLSVRAPALGGSHREAARVSPAAAISRSRSSSGVFNLAMWREVRLSLDLCAFQLYTLSLLFVFFVRGLHGSHAWLALWKAAR